MIGILLRPARDTLSRGLLIFAITAVQISQTRRVGMLKFQGLGNARERWAALPPRLLSELSKGEGMLLWRYGHLWRCSEGLIEPRPEIAMRKEIHAQQRYQVRQRP